MRSGYLFVLLALLVTTAGAKPTQHECRAACVQAALDCATGEGNPCRCWKKMVRRCRHDGVTSCAQTTTTMTTTTTTTTLPGSCAGTLRAASGGAAGLVCMHPRIAMVGGVPTLSLAFVYDIAADTPPSGELRGSPVPTATGSYSLGAPVTQIMARFGSDPNLFMSADFENGVASGGLLLGLDSVSGPDAMGDFEAHGRLDATLFGATDVFHLFPYTMELRF
jgi:hypothetical protein